MIGTKEFTNGEVTIVWKPESCIHSGICVKGLPKVFRPDMRPWIKIDGAESEDLINQVTQCPSGALSYYVNAHVNVASTLEEAKVEVMSNGPLLVHGTIKVISSDGSTEMKNKTTAFCRCGQSSNKPYCDGSHVKSKFKG
ncbi:(4Fe-4S)-binding protein [Flavisericum labens]|uniref:(4Fe-4S)-binding protein n=1 Tax=Flavisericum labens TaxID=3377112 RepID=UPI00387B5B34